MLIRHFPVNDVYEIHRTQIYIRSLMANIYNKYLNKIYCKTIKFADADKSVF